MLGYLFYSASILGERMSIYLSFFSEGEKKLFSKVINRDKISREIKNIVEQEDGQVMQEEDGSLLVKICPAGSISIRFEDNKIIGDALTSLAGPGFHKAVVDLLDKISSKLRIDIDVEDETTYINERDFKQLQRQHHQWLCSFIYEFINRENIGVKRMYVSWPYEEWVPIDSEGLITQMGIYDKEYCEKIVKEDKLKEFSKNYFPWFDDKKDALYYRGMALYLMWNDFCWVKPRTKEEIALAEMILSFLALARRMDPNIELPLKEWREISYLVGRKDTNVVGAQLPNIRQIGYRRKDIVVSIYNYWELIMPGRMIVKREGDELVVWDADKEIHLSEYLIDEEHPPFILKEIAVETSADSKLVEYVKEGGYHYKGRYRFISDAKSPHGKWILTGQINSSDSIIVVSISWLKDRDTNWAIETFSSVRRKGSE